VTTLRSGSAIDVGEVRTNNEDQLLLAEPLFAVADGMGGHAAGEVASLAAVETLRAAFKGPRQTSDDLIDAIKLANREVWSRSSEQAELRGMGTTLTAVALVEENGEDHLTVANVGDSRAYLLRDGELQQLTDDHSVAEQLVRDGQLSADEAAVHPQRHVLTRVLGMAPEVDVDAFPILPYRGDRLLLCTDGLVNEVADDEIASILRRVKDPEAAARELVRTAKANGGHDNIAVVVVDVVDDDDKAAAASAALAADEAGAAGVSGGSGTRPAASTLLAEKDESRPAPRPQPPVAAAPARATSGPPPERPGGLTVRVVLFTLVLVAVLAVAGLAVAFYARGGYYVGLDGDEVTIFKGRPGGLLGFDPTIEQHTGTREADVPPGRITDVQAGKEVASLTAARAYVRNLQDERAREVGAPAPPVAATVPPGAAPGVPLPPTGAPLPTPAPAPAPTPTSTP
jgi:protein phosphatase